MELINEIFEKLRTGICGHKLKNKLNGVECLHYLNDTQYDQCKIRLCPLIKHLKKYFRKKVE